MKTVSGGSEDGVVVGNLYDKYSSSNPIVKYLMKGFSASLTALVETASPMTIHEVGCGEGYWTLKWAESGLHARGSDFSTQVIEIARNNAEEAGLPPDIFQVRSVYNLQDSDSADLMLCCEVLEHLEHPDRALEALLSTNLKYLILSVPREPIWSVMNMARGRYWKDCGNTPGHLQRWSKKEFVSLVSRYFQIIEVRSPLPWTMLLCRKK